MNALLLILLLALGWAAALGDFSLPSLLFGGCVGAVCLFLVRRSLGQKGLLDRIIRVAALIGLFIEQLAISAFRVALLVVQPRLSARLRPAFVHFRLSAKTDLEITLLANLITLTPGTLSVDVSEDRQVLVIHVLDLADVAALRLEIAEGFERRVLEALR